MVASCSHDISALLMICFEPAYYYEAEWCYTNQCVCNTSTDDVIDFSEAQGGGFLHLWSDRFAICHSLSILLLFSVIIPTNSEHSKGTTLFSDSCHIKRRNWQCEMFNNLLLVLESVSLSMRLQLSQSAGSHMSFLLAPVYFLSSPPPSLSKHPGVGMGQLKPAYALTQGCSHATTNTHGTVLKHAYCHTTTQMHTKINNSRLSVVRATFQRD